jgi:FSR family fosmidomycin resistance protein-like MFS transporter
LSNSILGLVTTLFLVTASFSQPFYGYLADRIGPRWLITAGLLWMAAFISLGMLVQGWSSLVFLIIASMGSGAFHPAGAMQATITGQVRLSGREATAASFFFSFGQVGYLIGPLLGGPLLDAYGMYGILILTLAAIPVLLHSVFSYRQVVYQAPAKKAPGEKRPFFNPAFSRTGIAALLLVATCQAWAQQNMFTFMPKYLSDLGQPASIYGFLSALFMGGSALGNVIGGNIADQLGEKKVIMISMATATIPFLVIAMLGFSPWYYLLVPLAGALNGAAYSVIVVVAQRLIPGGMGLSSGLVLGFIFSSGALGALFSGIIADQTGVQFILYLTAVTALAGGLITSRLETGKKKPVVVKSQSSI